MEKSISQQKSSPQSKVEYWCFVCETVIEASVESQVIDKCALCKGSAIEKITPENDPRKFTPPTRQIQRSLISSARDKPSATKPHPDLSEHFPNESEIRIPDVRNHPLGRKHLSANRDFRIHGWQVCLAGRCQCLRLGRLSRTSSSDTYLPPTQSKFKKKCSAQSAKNIYRLAKKYTKPHAPILFTQGA